MPKVKHGEHGTRLYSIWRNMKQRCLNQNRSAYSAYGGRGISLCEEWKDYILFRDWAISNGYSDSLTLDRKNNELGYSPDNCRWATIKQQSNNTRTNRTIEYNGETHTLSEWAEILQMSVGTLWDRLDNGWSIQRALSEPVHNNGGKRRKHPNCGTKMEGDNV